MFQHITDATKQPVLIKLKSNIYVMRFEVMKLHSVLAAISSLLENKTISKSTTLLDSSSGIYAYSLALACNKFGLKCRIVASSTIDNNLLTQLKILGVHVDQPSLTSSLKLDQAQRISLIKEILRNDPSVYWMQQYHDDIHHLGYEPCAQLLMNALGTKNLRLVGGIGTGCSTGGLIKFLRGYDTKVALVGIQPFGSITFGENNISDPAVMIAGIGSTIHFKNVQHDLYDKLHWISFQYGMSASVELLRRHGIFAGLSTGINFLATLHEAQQSPDSNVVFLAADTGHRYVDKIFKRYQQALDIDQLTPTIVNSVEALSFPWSALHWNRKKLSYTNNKEH